MSANPGNAPRQLLWRLWLITVHMLAIAAVIYPLLWNLADTRPFGVIELSARGLRWDPHDTSRATGPTMDERLKPDVKRNRELTVRPKVAVQP